MKPVFARVNHLGFWIVGISISRRLHNSKDQTVFCLDLGKFALEVFL